jgi:holo-[acyl-carrier protein] synthase
VTTLAVGLDVVATAAFADQLADTASGFVAATFTAREQRATAAAGELRAQRLAARFAAKEAFVKAWSGARAGREPRLDAVDLREIEVVDDGHGRPALALHGAVAAALEELAAELGPGAKLRAHLSVSHDPPVAVAVVVLEVRAPQSGTSDRAPPRGADPS